MEVKYTLAPWKINYFDGTQICINSGNELIAVVYAYEEKKDEGNANARLIAAAPRLLDALKILLRYNELGEVESQRLGLARMIEARGIARDTIAEAEGRQP